MRWVWIITVLLLLVPGVSALSQVQVEAVDNAVRLSEEATFKVTIENTASVTRNFKLYGLDRGWIVGPTAGERNFDLAPNAKKTVTVNAKAVEAFKPGAYAPILYVDELVGDKYASQTVPLTIYLSPDTPASYNPAIRATVDMDEKIDPTGPVAVKLFLENRNPLDLKGVTLVVRDSGLTGFGREVTFDLPPLEKKTLEFAVTPSSFQQPKDYILYFVFERKGEPFKVVEKRVEVLTKMPTFAQDIVSETKALKTWYALTVTNNGNVENLQQVLVPANFWQGLFTRGKDGVVVQNGTRYLMWELSLSPQESQEIRYITNYRLMIYIVLVLILLGLFYWFTRSSVLVTKHAQARGKKEEGTLSEVKVTLEVRNVTGKPLKNIKIIDIVPGIANVKKELELGTLRPEKVVKTTQGTKVVWSLAELDAFEQRLITYSIRTSLKVVGTLKLSRARVEYANGRGRSRRAYSPSIAIEAKE